MRSVVRGVVVVLGAVALVAGLVASGPHRHDRRMRRLLFRLSRSRPMGPLVRWTFAHAAWLLPLRVVARTRRAVVFDHPQPTCEGHLLVVPRRAIRSLTSVTAQDGPWLRELWELAFARVAAEPSLALVVINAHAWQDVPQLHAHLLPADEVPPRAHELAIELADAETTLRRAQVVMRSEVPQGRGCALVLDAAARTASVVWGRERAREDPTRRQR